jgi:hypothetical protein
MFAVNFAPLGPPSGQDCKIVQEADCNVKEVCGMVVPGAANHMPKTPFKAAWTTLQLPSVSKGACDSCWFWKACIGRSHLVLGPLLVPCAELTVA